nr:FUSC family protein [Bacillus sp. FJAT-29790]
MVVGSAISWELAVLFGSKHPYLAPISLILCLQATIIKSIRFAIARIVGTIVGVASVFIFASSYHVNGWTIAMIMLISLVFPLILGANSTILHQIALSVLLVFTFLHKMHGYGIDRIRDSVIGVIIAVLLHILLYPPNFSKKALKEMEELPQLLVGKLQSLARWLESGASQNNYFESSMNQFRNRLSQVEQQFKKAELSLRFNPLSQKSKIALSMGESRMKTINKIATDIEFLFDIMNEWQKAGSLSEREMALWTENLLFLASVLNNWKEGKDIIGMEFKLNFVQGDNNEFYFPALWHSEHLITTLKHTTFSSYSI